MRIYQGNSLDYRVTGSTYSRIIFRAVYDTSIYIQNINKTLKRIGKIQFASELTILLYLICKFLNFTGVFTNVKIEIIKV